MCPGKLSKVSAATPSSSAVMRNTTSISEYWCCYHTSPNVNIVEAIGLLQNMHKMIRVILCKTLRGSLYMRIELAFARHDVA